MDSGQVIAMLLMWIVPLLAIVWMIGAASTRTKAAGAGHTPAETSDPVLRIVRERYAHGEIGRDEYERLLERLSSLG